MPAPADLVRLNRVEGAWRVGIRAGISVAVPLLVLVLIRRPDLAVYASFGSFTSLYGRRLPYFTRAQMQVSAGFVLVLSVVVGVLVGLENDPWLQVVVAAVIAACGQVWAKAHRFHPQGPLFLIFGFGVMSSIPHAPTDVLRAIVVSGLAALFSVLVGLAGLSLRPRDIKDAWASTGLLRLEFVNNWQPVWMALAVFVAGTAAHLAGIGHPYWAMVAALVPLSAPHVTTQLVRGTHRAVGTLLGLIPAWVLLNLDMSPTVIVLVVALLQTITEIVVGMHYAIAVLFITPMALLVGEISGRHPANQLVFDRGAETLIGCVVAFVITMIGHTIRQRRLRRSTPEPSVHPRHAA